MMMLFERASPYGYLRQEIIHSLVYLMKRKEILPFERYQFNWYFIPFSKYLQEDIDDAVDFKLLDKQLSYSSMAQWAYKITETGSAYINEITKQITGAHELTEKLSNFIKDSFDQGPVVLLETSYKSLNEEIMARLQKQPRT